MSAGGVDALPLGRHALLNSRLVSGSELLKNRKTAVQHAFVTGLSSSLEPDTTLYSKQTREIDYITSATYAYLKKAQ